jgi:thiaminase/transcriptional activator TenA
MSKLSKGTFTENLWNQSLPVYDKILVHPFIEQLIEGSLDRQIFSDYIHQDTLYLQDYARVLSMISSRCSDPALVMTFSKFASGAIATELALHQVFKPNLPEASVQEKNPACFAYTNFLLSQAVYQPLEVSFAAVLPCFWIYEEVGKYALSKAVLSDHPYKAWLETYAGNEFQALVEEMIEITENAAQQAAKPIRSEMEKAYQAASVLEYKFWNDAFHNKKGYLFEL